MSMLMLTSQSLQVIFSRLSELSIFERVKEYG